MTTKFRQFHNANWSLLYDEFQNSGMPYYNKPMDKKRVSQVISDCYKINGHRPTVILLDKLKQLGLTIGEFSKNSGIPLSTLNKILEEKRDLRLSTFRQIVKTVSRIEGGGFSEPFVAVIAARTTLDEIKTRVIHTGKIKIPIREYSAITIEDVLKAAVKAEKEGATVIVCAPIVSELVKDFVTIPIVTMHICEEDLMEAIKTAAQKTVKA